MSVKARRQVAAPKSKRSSSSSANDIRAFFSIENTTDDSDTESSAKRRRLSVLEISFPALLQDDSWQSKLEAEFSKEYCVKLEQRVQNEYSAHTVYPPAQLIFNAFNLTPFDKVRVVIIGQDPYHGHGQAHGLAFSVPRGQQIPPSLRNIYKELADNVDGIQAPSHGCLEAWARQGVLLLNATLTVRSHQANSHATLGWQTFTDHVIQLLSDSSVTPLVFLLWGRFAHRKAQNVDKTRHRVICTAHPSPLSARYFLGCRCFVDVNTALSELALEPITWQLK